MQSRLVHAFAIAIAVTLVLSARAAHAQVVAAGPYYATPSWDQTLPCTALGNCPRFIVLSNFNGGAVLDRETGLVWAQSTSGFGNYQSATTLCQSLPIANRVGWRLPGAQELTSLIDASNPAFIKLPAGHPFTLQFLNPAARQFWTHTGYAYLAKNVWVVDFSATFGLFGFPDYVSNVDINTDPRQFNIWCVRGPQLAAVE